MADSPNVDRIAQEIERIVEGAGGQDAPARRMVEDLVRLMMQLYGAGLGRMLEILQQTHSDEALDRVAGDKLLGSLMLLHGLHPEPAEQRVREALHRVQRKLDAHDVVLEDITDGVARVRVDRNGSGHLPATLGETIEKAIAEAAPDLAGVEVAGLGSATPLVQIEMARGR